MEKNNLATCYYKMFHYYALKLMSLEFQNRFVIDYFCLLSQGHFLCEFERRSQNKYLQKRLPDKKYLV
jgi:hypothetical protein